LQATQSAQASFFAISAYFWVTNVFVPNKTNSPGSGSLSQWSGLYGSRGSFGGRLREPRTIDSDAGDTAVTPVRCAHGAIACCVDQSGL
jgi:hypothetical protein